MLRTIGVAVFWLFQLLVGGLFAVAFIFAVPQAVENWFLRAVSVALGGLYGLGILAAAVIAVWQAVFGFPSAPTVCPRCGQPLPPKGRDEAIDVAMTDHDTSGSDSFRAF